MNRSNGDIFKGKRVIRFDPDEMDFRTVLETAADLHDRFKEKKNVFIRLKKGSANPIEEIGAGVPLTLTKKGAGKIEKIQLLYPVLPGDKRWQTIRLTAASLFIGSALANASFDVKTQKQTLPAAAVDSQILDAHLIGLTLFEDLFTPVREFLSLLKVRHKYGGIIAAGGPMITLNPFQSAFQLPALNLLVRGEAEFVLPRIIRAINANDIPGLLACKGLLFQIPGTVVISDFNEINRPGSLEGFRFNLDFLEKHHFEEGLEINVSRGCKRSCLFCSAVQGKEMRKLPAGRLADLLEQFHGKLASFAVRSPHGRTVNITDDDILQDPDYAGAVFQAIKNAGFRLWGIQTSIHSFFTPQGGLKRKTLDIIDDKGLYVENNPLVWAGTDAFLETRGKKLGKFIPAEHRLNRLLQELEKRRIRNYHYWISSDHDTGWQEFSREFTLLYRLQSRFTYFGLIAHSPFLVPYSTAPLYRLLTRSDHLQKQIKYKTVLESKKEIFRFPLVERVETPHRHLNRLLTNERLPNRLGFFDYLHRKNYLDAFITLYDFLKQERIDAELSGSVEMAGQLKKVENEVETFISGIM